ncbi:Phosphate starvation-inducible protein [Leptospira borgpetersenii serovar Hardjo-bovis str. L550]|uniref:PhoH-like protein n=1 Tax=Leptospira borgpetersenii serovar Hardjo-bovis (strain JB197) TaxID=355277 RepID=Q04TG7_LEPBJ|nr:Phosphate starvation-inducible protein [Leptospira borgpetersenii serovar Hardjo-bovis str. JB197]ABJ78749.1 Phosphate starvation-inducible protein [Leptospira borgpetersenii serovar Hardjo-bovis str. L550]
MYRKICGINDEGVKILEKQLEMDIIPRGNGFQVEGESAKVEFALDFFKKIEANYRERPDRDFIDLFDFAYILKDAGKELRKKKARENEPERSTPWKPSDKILTTYRGKHIFPRTRNQEIYFRSFQDNLITFALGPAGTGKTFLSVATACRFLQAGTIDKIILTRPAVEAGENLGFLPGDLNQKVDPYLRPVYDALNECIGPEKTQEYISLTKIEIAPVAFMRGRTLSNAFIILDEAQNCTLAQLKMIMTRLGRNSRMCISGDSTQIDLDHGRSGLEKVVTLFKNTDQIGMVFFGKEDITRHPLVEVIVRKFEEL